MIRPLPPAALPAPMTPGTYLRKRREAKFLEHFPDSVDVIVRGIKSGLPVHECFKIIARESPAPLGPEFQKLVEGLGVGLTLEQALELISAKAAKAPKKAAPKKKAAPEIHEEEEDKPVEIKKLAIPRYSPAQLAAKAKKEGDAPDIVKDEITKVTLFDYSDIFADEDEDEDEYYDDED